MSRVDATARELPYLEAFHAVCTEGGFTAAAHRLGCTQPAISYRVKSLERAMGVRLVERGGRRMLLTPAGERVRQLCEELFAELARVRSEVAGAPSAAPLRLSSASGFGRYVLMPALRRLQETATGAGPELRVRFDTAEVVLRGLERGECDAAFVYTRRISNRLRYRVVYDEELALIGAVGEVTPARLAAGLSTLESLPFVTYDEGDYVFGRWFEANFGEPPAQVRSAAHFSELEEVIDFVGRRVGLSIVPRDAAESACGRGEVEILYAGRGAPCLNPVHMVVRSGSTVGPELRRLAALLREQRRPGAE